MNRQRYYKLWFSDDDLDPFLVSAHDLRGVDRRFVYRGTYVDDWPSDVSLVGEGGNPTDYLAGLPAWIVVSHRVKEAIQKCEITGTQFLPVIVRHKSGIELPGYSLLNVFTIVPALDYKETRWLTPAREKVEHPQFNIVKIALQYSAISTLDIFRIEEDPINVFVSQRLIQCLETAQATSGFRFIPVKTT